MTIGEVRVLEKDATMFLTDSSQNNLPEEAEKQTLNQIKLEEGTNKIDVESRFARLKKSLRKRSVSIL